MNDTPPNRVDALDRALRTATDEIRPNVLLLSGGVDSSLLAAMWTAIGHPFRAITVALSPAVACVPAHRFLPYPCNSDVAWAKRVAEHLALDWTPIVLDQHEALETLDWLIMQQRSFDLGQLNNIALAAALRSVSATSIATGDDGDGLFGGYRLAADIDDWPAWIGERIPHIDPPVSSIASSLEHTSVFPYLHKAVLDVVRTLSIDDIRSSIPRAERPVPPAFMDQFAADAMEGSTQTWGKVVLRQVAERYLPADIAWRPKTDLQFGSGMCALEPILASRVAPGLLMNFASTGIRFFNDAHRGLYLRFRGLGLEPPAVGDGEYACASCGGGVPIGKRHCTTCGCWPADDGQRGSDATTTSN